MDTDTKEWLLAAARRAARRYPGAVGELLSQELLSWMVFGHRLGSELIMRVADDLLLDPSPRDSLEAATDLSTGRENHPARSHGAGDRNVYPS